jgi:hypothetical protein
MQKIDPVLAEELGERIGEIIVGLVDVIAMIDGSSRDEVLETLFSGYVVSRITDMQEGG